MHGLNTMKCCIFNSLAVHYEMYAYVLDYFKEKKLSIDVYTNKTNQSGWLDFYEQKFNITTWFPISFFNASAYDYVFLLTDDDTGYEPFWNHTTRVIVVEHDGKRRLNLKSYCTIQTRQFKLREPPDPDTWVMPVWNNLSTERFNKLTVLSIGNSSNGINLPSLFSNFNEIDFILVDRYINSANTTNITRYNNLSASSLIEIAKKAHYIVFWPTNSFLEGHKYHSISGAFPLAFTVGTPLLMPESFIEPLGLDGITGISGSIHLEKPTEELYSNVLLQRDILLKKRNSVFDSILSGYRYLR